MIFGDLYDAMFPIGIDRDKKMNLAEFTSAIVHYASGLLTAAEIISQYELEGDAARELVELLSGIDALTTDGEKALHCMLLSQIVSDIEINRYSDPQIRHHFRRRLGIGPER